jgi:electron transport complex protein RnfB
MNVILIAVIVLGGTGIVLASVIFLTAKKFRVFEDPRIDEVQNVLPGANCGGCAYPGCRNFAEACVKSESLDGLLCPVGGNEVMKSVASILGLDAVEAEPLVAVLRCNGTCANRPKTNRYEGVQSCMAASLLYGGDTACTYGCLGMGDCVAVCQFDALYMDKETGLPVVDEAKCTSCGACVRACPKQLFELRKKGPKSRRIFVSCMNKDKGAPARKACSVACIGCGKCEQVCAFDAITIKDNLAYIDFNACRLCRKCVEVCPTNSIWELNFPPRKKAAVQEASAETLTGENTTTV